MTTRDTTKLICLPYAGAGASFYRPWTALAGDALEIVPLQLPGRERLIDEEPYRDVHQAVDGLLPQLREQLGDGDDRVVPLRTQPRCRTCLRTRPPAGRRARRRARPPVRQRVAAPRPRAVNGGPPACPTTTSSPASASSRATSHPALDDPEMREMLLPTLRADVEMHENYVPRTDCFRWTRR